MMGSQKRQFLRRKKPLRGLGLSSRLISSIGELFNDVVAVDAPYIGDRWPILALSRSYMTPDLAKDITF